MTFKIRQMLLATLLASAPSCLLSIDKTEEKDVSPNNALPSSPVSTDENDNNQLPKTDPNIVGLSPFGFTQYGSNPSDNNSVLNNRISDTLSIGDLVSNASHTYQGRSFYHSYVSDQNLRTAAIRTLKPGLEALASSEDITLTDDLTNTWADYLIGTLFDNEGYDIGNNGGVYATKTDDGTSYLTIILNNPVNQLIAYTLTGADQMIDYSNQIVEDAFQ